jgi:hypothetical protein
MLSSISLIFENIFIPFFLIKSFGHLPPESWYNGKTGPEGALSSSFRKYDP